MITEITYLASNTIISLYGVLIKYYSNITIFEQLFIRTVAFVIISVFGLLYNNYSIIDNIFSYDSIMLSIINLTSIYGIYISYKELGIGITNSIFYTWPVLLYLSSIPILHNKFSMREFTILIITMLSMLLILSNKLKYNLNIFEIIGLIGLFVSIFTHIATILYFKKTNDNIHAYLLKQYGFALIIMIIFMQLTNTIEIKKEYIPIFLYSLIIGYIGFYLNFYSIKKLSPFKISILEFLSIAISFFLGFTLFRESTKLLQWVGVVCIIILNYYSFNFLKI